MEVEANNSTACNLAQKLICLEDIEGGKFVIAHAAAESATDNRFIQSLNLGRTLQLSVAVWWFVL